MKSCPRLKKIKIHSNITRNKYRQSIPFRIKRWNEVETRVSIPESLWFRLSSGRQITHWGESRSTTTATIQIHPPPLPPWWRISAISGPLFVGKRRKRGDERPVPCAKITEEMTTPAGGLLFPRPTFHSA